jgi:serine-type D-Ala-D-Ala carboxypeptidase/endopeptidase (penicillin-binding protein 4)
VSSPHNKSLVAKVLIQREVILIDQFFLFKASMKTRKPIPSNPSVLFFLFFIGILLLSFGLMRISDHFSQTSKEFQLNMDATTIEAAPSEIEQIEQDTNLTALDKLNQMIEYLDTVKEMQHGLFGGYLAEVESGKIILEYNSKKTLQPASILKLITTGIALYKLGPSYTYKTSLQYDGELDTIKRVLRGNIFIRGSGDPTLGSNTFGYNSDKLITNWCKLIKKLGIDSIQGAIVADERLFDYEMIPIGWTWEDMQNDYGAGVTALSINENVMEVSLEKGNIKKVYPDNIPELKWVNLVSLSEDTSKTFIYAAAAPYEGKRILYGIARKGLTIGKIPLPDPPYMCSYALWKALEKDSISVRDSASTMRKLSWDKKYVKTEKKTFYVQSSVALKHILTHTNTVSQNFYAESLLKSIAVADQRYGSGFEGSEVIRKFWKEKNLDLYGYYQVDGSGLSRLNGLTPKQLGEMLIIFARDSIFFREYEQTLAVAGRTGTLQSIGKGSSAEGNIRAKSGSMSRVRSYAGYGTNKKGQKLVFVWIANNYAFEPARMKAIMERMMVLITEIE